MNTTTLRISMLVAAVALVAFTGCTKKGRNGGMGAGIDDGSMMIGAIEEDGMGLELSGLPFDASRDRATDVAVQPIYFGYDSFVLPPSEMAKVQQAIDILNQNENYVMIIEGHCDDRGSNEYNLSLGEQRALAVRNTMIAGGIDASRIQSRSFGEERPAVIGSGEDVWRLNRRGEFAFYR